MINKSSFEPKSFFKHKGFSLLELMIVITIIGILIAVVLPNYESYIIRSNRSDAIKALVSTAALQEQFYIANQTYATSMSDLSAEEDTENNHYKLTIVSANAVAYLINANPNASGTSVRQTGDGSLRINSVGRKTWDCKVNSTYSCDWQDALN